MRRVPTYRLHRPTGQAVVTLSGKDHYLGRHGTPASRERYERLVAEWLTRPRNASAAGATVSVLVAGYLRHCDAYYMKLGRPTRQGSRVRCAARPLRELYGSLPAAAFGVKELKAVREAMVRRGWTRKFVNAAVVVVKALYRWAAEEGLVPAAAWQSLQAVRNLQRGRTSAPDPEPVGPVSAADVEATLPFLPGAVADLVRVQRLAGMRPCEAVAMKGGDVDRQGRLPGGGALAGVWVYEVKEEGNKLAHKGVKRVVLLGPAAQAVLAPYLLRTSGYLFSPHDAPKASRSPGRRTGERYTTGSYGRAVTRACRRAGVPPWTPNQLRHAAATEMRAAGGLGAASAALGHEGLETTLTYAEQSWERAAEAVRRIG